VTARPATAAVALPKVVVVAAAAAVLAAAVAAAAAAAAASAAATPTADPSSAVALKEDLRARRINALAGMLLRGGARGSSASLQQDMGGGGEMEAVGARDPEGTAPSRGRSARPLSTTMPPGLAHGGRSASRSVSPPPPPHLPLLLLPLLLLDPDTLLRAIVPLTLFPTLLATPLSPKRMLALSLMAPQLALAVPLPLLLPHLLPLALAAPLALSLARPSRSLSTQSLALLYLVAGGAQGQAGPEAPPLAAAGVWGLAAQTELEDDTA
jgi:hypothetical protein